MTRAGGTDMVYIAIGFFVLGVLVGACVMAAVGGMKGGSGGEE